jgi:two-component system alkaline phosphatase synthesis response regulator PhoP
MPTKILLVEDDPFILRMYETKFQWEKLEVKVADNGLDGLKYLEDFDPDIVLLDLLMPELDGFEVLRKIRADSKHNKLPVIVLSNINQDEDIRQAMELGATDYFVKSELTPSQVVDRIKEVLKRSVK